MKTRFLLCILLGFATLFTGCAQDVGDIDRTQPNKLKKDVFEGEWYMRQTIVGVPGTGMVGFEGYEGQMERIRWRFQEGLLVAHRVHEDVLGIDTSAPPLPTAENPAFTQVNFEGEWEGAPVAAFPIQMHFDVQRAYNSSTGEQTNVITENMSDRHWSEREYVRVQWNNRIWTASNNLFVALNYYSDSSWYEDGQSAATPLLAECRNQDGEFYQCDIDDLDHDEEVSYLEVTNSFVIAPSWINCILTFGFPLYGGDCGPETIQVKTSIVKIDPEQANDYEPRLYTDNEMEWFGFFRTERCSYDRLYGCRDQSTIRLANRHNIWQEWFNDLDGDGEFTSGDTRIPYNEREVRPVVYYLTPDFPTDLMDESVQISDQYDEAFTDIVRNVKDQQFDGQMFYLCLNTGTDAEIARIQEAIDAGVLNAEVDGLNVIEYLNKGYEDGACTRPEYAKRLGDVRYNLFAWVDSPQQRGPLGYGPSSTDPLTGETVGANAYIYGASIDTYAQYTVDLVELINGNIDPLDYGFGENVSGYLEDAYESFGIVGTGFEGADYDPSSNLDSAARSEKIAELTTRDFDQMDEKVTAALERRQGHFGDRLQMLDQNPGELIRHQNVGDAIWNKMKDTEIEARMITPEIKAGLGAGLIHPDDPITDEVVENLSPRFLTPPSNGMTLTDLRDPGLEDPTQYKASEYWERFNTFASRNMYMAEFLDDTLVGLAIDMREKYGNVEDNTERQLLMWYEIRGMIYKHVMEHEVGHTVGLRHNFEGTTDAMSFNPEYWRIRLANDAELAKENRECPGVPQLMLGDHHCPSRGLTRLDHEQRITEFAYSTTMDYGAKPNATSHGIGLYDRAALAYAYGELVHVFPEGNEPQKVLIEIDDSNFGLDNDASEPVRPSGETLTDWDDIEVVKSEVTDDGYVNADLDYWHYSLLPVMFDAEGNNNSMERMYDREYVSLSDYGDIDDPNRVRVPYGFCSDEYRGGRPDCNVWDNGADYNEIIETYIQSYDAYYFHNSYRRGRSGWGLFLWPHMTRLYGRYFGQLSNLYQHWVIRASSWGALWQLNPYAGGLQQIGVEDGLRKLLGVLAEPHPGSYEYVEATGHYENYDSDTKFAEENEGSGDWIALEPGMKAKHRISRFDYDSGYYYFLRYQILSSFWDRWAALWALTNPSTNTIGVDASSDITAYSIPFYLLYSYELSQHFGGIMTEDFTAFSPVVNKEMMQNGVDARQALEYRDPLGSISKRNAYNDPTKYTPVNPYPGAYGNQGFNDRYFATVYSLAYFQVLYDKSFNHASEIAILPEQIDRIQWKDQDGDGLLDIEEGDWDNDGDGIPAWNDADEQPLPGERSSVPDLVTYQDPLNNKVYSALDYTGGRAPLYSPAVAILNKANFLKHCWRSPGAADCADLPEQVNEFDIQNIREDIENIMTANSVFAEVNNPYWILFIQ